MIGKTVSHYPAERDPVPLYGMPKSGIQRDKIVEKIGEARPPERCSRAGPNDHLAYLGGMNYGW